MNRRGREENQEGTAKDAKNAKENQEGTAKDAKNAKENPVGTAETQGTQRKGRLEPQRRRERQGNPFLSSGFWFEEDVW